MYVLKTYDGNFYVITSDSHGYTVDWVTQDEAGATKFNTRAEAVDMRREIDDYWREQCAVALVESLPF